MDPDEARRRFAAARVARLATTRPDGRPHLVALCFAVAGDTVYSAVDEKPKRTARLARLANLAADPRAALLADHYDDADWSAQPPSGPVIAVDVERWSGWSAAAPLR